MKHSRAAGARPLFVLAGTISLLAIGCGLPDESQGPDEAQRLPQGPETAAAVPKTGLVGNWKLNETSGDTAHDNENNYDAVVHGGAVFVAGKVLNALKLDNGTAGTGGKYAEMPNTPALDTVQRGNYTISAWYHPASKPSGTGASQFAAVVTKFGQHMGIVYNSAQKFVARHYLTGAGGPDLEIANSGTNTYPLNTWHHVASVVNKAAGTLTLYVNGDPVGTESFTPGAAAHEYGTTPFRIGRAETDWAADGIVDQVRIYNVALSAAQIDTLATEQAATQPPSRPLPVGISQAGAVGSGPGNDMVGQQWTVLHEVPSPNTIAGMIDAADQKDVLLMLTMPGNKGKYTDAQGNFSMSMYISSLDRFVYGKANAQVTQAVSDKIEDAMARRRIVCYIVDEPNLNNEEVAGITPAQVAQMAAEHKTRWDCLTIARVTPTLLKSGWDGSPRPANGYPKLDYAWSQYSYAQAKTGITPSALWAQERAAIATGNLDIGLLTGLNLWAGGINQTTDGQQPCWDYADNNASSGYVLGDREPSADRGDPRNCGTLGSSPPSLIASPGWIEHYTQQVANDGGFPFITYWQHTIGTVSSEFTSYYTRRDFVDGFENAIETGLAAQAAPWRTSK